MKKIIVLFMLFLIGILIIPYVQAIPPKRVDVLFLGDGQVGKSCLRSVLTGHDRNVLNRNYTPTIETNFVTSFININDRQIALLYWDSPGASEVKDQLIRYGAKRCPFIVVALDLSKHTYNQQTREGVDVVTKYVDNYILPLRECHKNAYVIACGTKKDLVSPEKTRHILEQLEPYKNRDSFRNYFDCIATSSTEDAPSVMEIENIIRRVLESGQINIDGLEDYNDDSYTRKTLPSGVTIGVRKGLCQIL